jgi:hypothetical protein
MHSLDKFLLLCTILCIGKLIGSFPTVVEGAVIKAREGNVGGDRNGSYPVLNVTRPFEVLRLPTGFNFSSTNVNITHEDFGGMTTFAESEITKIKGAMTDDDIFIITVHCYTNTLTDGEAPNAPMATDLTPIVHHLQALDDSWCCQKEVEGCTTLGTWGTATADLCGPHAHGEALPECIRCRDAGESVYLVQWLCEDKLTNKAEGYVRYVSHVSFSGAVANGVRQALVEPFKRGERGRDCPPLVDLKQHMPHILLGSGVWTLAKRLVGLRVGFR